MTKKELQIKLKQVAPSHLEPEHLNGIRGIVQISLDEILNNLNGSDKLKNLIQAKTNQVAISLCSIVDDLITSS